MTPGARAAAAIAILDDIGAGTPAEQALTRWARASRFAGSKDRAAVRDHVFDVLRHWRSDAARGGAETGRGRMLGRLRAQGIDPGALFSGEGHAPAPLSLAEQAAGRTPDAGEALDLPDWLIPLFRDSLGGDADATAQALQARAPVTVRINSGMGDKVLAMGSLAEDGIVSRPNPRAPTALTVTDGARRLRQSRAYQSGLVELQDASSQAAVLAIPGRGRALDYCAGGGGKSLALAAAGWSVTAHDADHDRMRDLPARAARGRHPIDIATRAEVEAAAPFDMVLCDVPCSGSGTWRRSPDAKWHLTPERLGALCDMQASILDAVTGFVPQGGALCYATCSVLRQENADQITNFVQRTPGWECVDMHVWPVDADGDGFFLARLRRV